MSSVGWWSVLLLVLACGLYRFLRARQRLRPGKAENRLDAITQLAFGGVVAFWAHRTFAPYADRFEPAVEVAVLFGGFTLGFLAAVDVFKNALGTDSRRAKAHFAIAAFIAISLAATSVSTGTGSGTATKFPRADEQMLLEIAASRGPVTAPPGTVPPFLEVVHDDGEFTIIRNLMDRPLRIRLTRNADGYRCKMYFDGLERGDSGAAFVQAGQTQTFAGSTEPQCRAGLPLPPLEFEAAVTSSPMTIWRTNTLAE